MRELEKMREKATVQYEGRQVFGIFFAAVLIGSGIFVAGVWVGKRMAQPLAPDLDGDPLAVIDQLGNEEEILSFEKGLKKVAASAPKLAIAAPAPLAPDPVSATPTPTPTTATSTVDQALTAADVPPVPAPEVKSTTMRYTLQISSFQDRAEADTYAQGLIAKGYQAFVVSSEVPGKGLWYRVRMGEYTTYPEALEAKSEFERKNNVVAYVFKVNAAQ